MTLGQFLLNAIRLYFGGKLVLSSVRNLSAKHASSAIGDIGVASAPRKGVKPKLTTYRVYSLEDRMKHIIRLTNEGRNDVRIRKVAATILNRKCAGEWCIKEKDWDSEARAIFAFVKRKVRYTRDIADKDTYQHPVRTLEMGIADCDDMSSLIGSLLLSSGYPVKLRVVRTNNSKDWNHIFPLVGLPPGSPTRWIAMDASVSKPMGWYPPPNMIAATKDFNV